jgi:Na+-driven multidrug efflux pump
VGDSIYSLVMSAIRQLIVLLPAAYLLSLTGNLDAVWLSFPIAEIAALIVSSALLKKVLKKLNF